MHRKTLECYDLILHYDIIIVDHNVMIASCVLIWSYYYKDMTLKYQYMELYSDDRSFSRLDMALYWESMPFQFIAMAYYNVRI